MSASEYDDYILSEDEALVREIQEYLAGIHAEAVERDERLGKVDGPNWSGKDAEHVAAILNRSKNPVALFRFMDERTGSSYVGYRTHDDREWFHLLRQMRNMRGSGLLENLKREEG